MTDIYDKFKSDNDKINFLSNIYEPEKIKKIEIENSHDTNKKIIEKYFKEITSPCSVILNLPP